MNLLTLIPAAVNPVARSLVAWGIVIAVGVAILAVVTVIVISIIKTRRMDSEQLPDLFFGEEYDNDFDDETEEEEEEVSAFSLDLDDEYVDDNGKPISEAEEMFQRVRSQPSSRRAAREEEKSFFSRFKK